MLFVISMELMTQVLQIFPLEGLNLIPQTGQRIVVSFNFDVETSKTLGCKDVCISVIQFIIKEITNSFKVNFKLNNGKVKTL